MRENFKSKLPRGRVSRRIIAVLVVFTATLSCSGKKSAVTMAPRIHKLDFRKPYEKQDYAFLETMASGRSIVQLGESIHVTEEMPLARLPLVRFLHEEMGFDAIAFEGSLLDAWLAQDALYRPAAGSADAARKAQQLAWFNLWQTAPMLEVMEYVLAQSHAAHPLYLTSFDMQIGRTRAAAGSSARSLGLLMDALRAYGAGPALDTTQTWVRRLSPYLDCQTGANFSTGSTERVSAWTSIEGIEALIRNVRPNVETKSSAMHARALALVPSVLRQNFQLCEATHGVVNRHYAEVRDPLMAVNVENIRNDISSDHRIITWAHHSHLYYDSAASVPRSMGSILAASHRNELLTIGTFAGEGTAFDTAQADRPGIFGFLATAPRRIRPAKELGVERRLAAESDGDYVLDLTRPEDLDDWATMRTTSRFEPWGVRPVSLARDFDGAIFLSRVSSTDLTFISRPVAMALRAVGLIRDHLLLIAVFFMAAMYAIFVTRRRARTKRSAGSRGPESRDASEYRASSWSGTSVRP